MTIKRDAPYVWVTWVTGLLSGDAHCEWAAWFKAHNTGYAKPHTKFDLMVWKAEHGAKVRARADALRDAGYKVYVENQNKFTFKGSGGVTLNGVVAGVDNFSVATNIRIFLEDQNHVVDLDMPDENCNIRMR